MKKHVRALAAFSLLAAAGCGAGDYMAARGSDLADVFVFRGGTGFGANATLKATDLLHSGLGLASVHMFGFQGRRNREIQGGEMGFVLGHAEDFYVGPREQVGESCYISPFLDGIESDRTSTIMDRFCVEARVTALIVTLDFGVNPAELLDFFAGFSTLDFAGDDAKPPEVDPYGEDPKKGPGKDPYADEPKKT